jgi:hypothetical protein
VILISWSDNAANEDSMELQISSNGGASWTVHSLAANTTGYEDTGLEPATQRWYRVRAQNAAGVSAFSNTASATTWSPPLGAPANLTATALSDSAVLLSWADNASGEQSFELQRRIGSGWQVVATLPANNSTYIDGALAAGTSYTYRTRARNGPQFSDYSNLANATTSAEIRPLPARAQRDVAALDENGDGISDIAVLADDGVNRVRLINGLTKQQIRTINFLSATWLPVAIAALPDTDNDGASDDPSIALLAHNPASTDRPHVVQIRRAVDGTLVRNMYFLGSGWQVIDVAAIDDANGNGTANDPAIGVLGFHPSTGKIAVQRRRLHGSLSFPNTYFLGADWTPIALEAVSRPGAPWLGVLAVKSGGAGEIVVQSRRLTDGAVMKTTHFFDGAWRAQDAAVLADLDGKPATDDPAYAVLATRPSTGISKLQLRRALTGALVREIPVLGADWRVIAVSGGGNVGGNVTPELGVLAENPATGKVMTQLRESGTATLLKNLSTPAPAKDEQWVVRLFNHDDVLRLTVNGQTSGACTAAGECSFEVDTSLLSGANALRIDLQNANDGWAYGYEIKRDGIVWAYGSCGTAGSASCGSSTAIGTVFSKSFNIGF